jgi:SAM-dependent methyltransferase
VAAEAASGDEGGPALETVCAGILDLPVADGSFDAVFTRSVLIYVADKAAAVRELHRVLRSGGRASIFEPINEVSLPYGWGGGRDLAALQPEHDRITAYLLSQSIFKDVMAGFDERDLVRWFVEAGFSGVGLRYEQTYQHGPARRTPAALAALLSARPNPATPSYEEGARAVLGEAADGYLVRYVDLLRAQAGTWMSGSAYVSAVR